MTEKLDIDQLVELSKAGDSQAFGQIYDELVKPVYRYIYYRVAQEVAEDLTEEAFFKAWQNLKKYKKGKHPFSSWLFRIAHNLVVDHYRKNQPVEEIDERTPVEGRAYDPKSQAQIKLTQVRIRKVIRKLPENYQQVIILRYINEMDHSEIARITGKSEGAVRTLQTRALDKLRVLLADEQEVL